ncbi:MAG TPA: DUF805 domain-containing protein [Caulobacteraceae bacterium]|jgi:uncharacterized membrane protein YhaH (DUF805 family)
MIGSLDNPPVMIRAPRFATNRSTLTALTISVAFTAAGLALATGQFHWLREGSDPTFAHIMDQLLGAVILAAGAYIIVVRGWAMISPATLEVGPEGIVTTFAWSKRRLTWSDMRNFRVVSTQAGRAIAFDLIGAANRQTFARSVYRKDYGADAILWRSGDPRVDLNALAALLNEARDRWNKSADAIPTNEDSILRSPQRGLLWRLFFGRISRREYWFTIACLLPLVALIELAYSNAIAIALVTLSIGYSALCCPVLARLRDFGAGARDWKSVVCMMGMAWGLMISATLTGSVDAIFLVSALLVGSAALIFPGVLPSTPGANAFGPPPKGPEIVQVPRP